MGEPHQDGPDPAVPANGEPPAYTTQGAPGYWAPHLPPSAYGGVSFGAAPPVWAKPPDHSRLTLVVLGVVGLALLAVVAVVAVVAVTIVTMGQLSSTAGPERKVVQNATECTDGVSNGEVPTGEMVSAGGLFFPRDVAPGWDLLAEPDEPNSVDAVTLQQEVAYDESEGIGWLANVTVGNTNFDPSLSLSDQAQLMLTCIVSKSYAGASPTLRATNAISSRLDGLPTATVEAAISAVAFDPAITGDDVVLTIVGTTPTSYFLGTSPIGDASRRTVVQAARRELHVSQV